MGMIPTRRTFLRLAATLAAPAHPATTPAALDNATPSDAAPSDEYDTLRHRWLTLSLGTGYDPNAEPYASRLRETGDLARRFRATMAPTARSLWPDQPYDPPAGITRSYSRLWTMTQAYTRPGTGATTDPALLADVLRGLDHLSTTVYNPSTTRYGNWWEWQIGSPRLLMDIVAALYDELTPAQRDDACAAIDHFIPDSLLRDYTGTSTGANRVDLCRSVALRGILGRTPQKIALARDALSPVFPYVTQGDGLYADGSFVQHTWVAYSGTYGQVLLDGLGRLFALLAESTWDVTDPGRQIVLDSVERAYAPLIHDGLVMDSVNGRAISRGHLKSDDRHVLRSDHFHGQGIIAAIALLALGASTAERERWYGRVKGWIERDTVTPILTAPRFEVADLARLHTVAASPVPAAPEPVGHHLFAAMDRAVHRRPGFTVTIAMASDRIAHYECGNGENPRGWHTGAGMTLWWAEGLGGRADRADQYTDWYWPTVDWYRLPGTTVSTKPLADREGGEWGAPKPAVRWVGGTTDGEYAAIGQHLKGLGSTLEARKSWFCVADCVICLGAGISCADGVPVETVVDSRNLGENGTQAFVRGPGWAHLEGHGGWAFPTTGTADPSPATEATAARGLRTLREDRTGAWADINTGGTTERRTRRRQTLWLDHGTDPSDASYLYVLMPGASREAVARRAADHRWLSVLANDATRQAIAVPSLGLTAANFWRAGTAGPVTASAGASVLVRRHGRTATLCVSEPPRTGRPIEIIYEGPFRSVLRADDTVEVLETTAGRRHGRRRLRLRVTPGTACATHTCELLLAG
ncbi:polysaccharide lyase 8 family protein [Streptomyces sp. NPDC002643]